MKNNSEKNSATNKKDRSMEIAVVLGIILIGIIIVSFLRGAEIKKAVEPMWENVEKNDSIEAYQNFLHNLNIRLVEIEALETTGKGTEERKFIVQQIKGIRDKYTEKALGRIDILYWERACENNNIENYIDCIDNNPNGKFVSDAYNRILSLSPFKPHDMEILICSLQKWHAASVAAEVLEKNSWQPYSIEEKIHFQVAKRNGSILKKNWTQTKHVLLNDVESQEYKHIENALYALIGLGRDEIIPLLIEKLNTKGNKTMAEAFLNCGHTELDKAAKEWARRYGYTIQKGFGAYPVSWGSW
jgi:hypothetical protein